MFYCPQLYVGVSRWHDKTVCVGQGNLKGESVWQPSCRHVWRGVIVPPDFLVVKPAKQV